MENIFVLGQDIFLHKKILLAHAVNKVLHLNIYNASAGNSNSTQNLYLEYEYVNFPYISSSSPNT